MTNGLPLNAPNLTDNEDGDERRSRDALEHEILTLDAKIKRLASREAGQRHLIRWIAVITGLFVIGAMLVLLGHTLHKLNWWPILRPPTPFLVVIVVAPIVSISAITIALFVGAFRGFKEKDYGNIANGVSEGARYFTGSQ